MHVTAGRPGSRLGSPAVVLLTNRGGLGGLRGAGAVTSRAGCEVDFSWEPNRGAEDAGIPGPLVYRLSQRGIAVPQQEGVIVRGRGDDLGGIPSSLSPDRGPRSGA